MPYGVAVGHGSVWVVAHGSHGERDSQLLRIDPATGKITHRTRFAGPRADRQRRGRPRYVWVVGASSSTLYRVDARTGERRGRRSVVDAGSPRAPRPSLTLGRVWVGVSLFWPNAGFRRQGRLLSPRAGEAWGEGVGAFGSVWVADAAEPGLSAGGGEGDSGRARTPIRAVDAAPVQGGGCLTSIAAGAGGIWVTVASSYGGSCGP